MKLPPGDLNPDPCPPHSTNTYICRVTIASKVCGDPFFLSIFKWLIENWSIDFLILLFTIYAFKGEKK